MEHHFWLCVYIQKRERIAVVYQPVSIQEVIRNQHNVLALPTSPLLSPNLAPFTISLSCTVSGPSNHYKYGTAFFFYSDVCVFFSLFSSCSSYSSFIPSSIRMARDDSQLTRLFRWFPLNNYLVPTITPTVRTHGLLHGSMEFYQVS